MSDFNTISFPGWGIDPFVLKKVAFSIGKINVYWYGIIITCGIALAFLYAWYRGKKNEGVVLDDIIDIGLLTVTLGIIGARMYYVLTTLDEYNYDNFYDVIAIWEGGLAIYGGIIGGCIGILIVCAIKHIRWQKIFDMIAPGVMIAQALGRWGNFFNGEAYGYAIGETTQFYFFNTEHLLNSGEGTFFHFMRMGLNPGSSGMVYTYYHPTFLYESVWNILGFVLINLFYKRKKFDGQIALMYFTWYGLGRMFIEGLRTDSLYIPGTTLRISQCLGLVCFVVGLTLILVLSLRKKPILATAGEVADTAEEPVEETVEACEENEMVDSAKSEEFAESDASESNTEETEKDENGKID